MKTQQDKAAYAARIIRAFLDDTCGPYDWDDFTSCSLRDPLVDSIRLRASDVDLPVNADGKRELLALADEADGIATAESAKSSDYLIGRFFVGLLALAMAVILISIVWELHSGVVHHRTGGMSVRANDPQSFWISIAIQIAIAVGCGWQSYRLRRFARSD